MKLVLISADGIGAGKTTLATKVGTRVTLADGIREELAEQYPDLPWFTRDQWAKSLPQPALDGKSMRDLLITRGMEARQADPEHWCKRLVRKLLCAGATDETYAIDDIRFINECRFFRAIADVVHVHIEHSGATPEPQYENEQLKGMSDYVIKRGA